MTVIRNYETIEWALQGIKEGKYFYRDGELVSAIYNEGVGFKCGKGGYLGYTLVRDGKKRRVLVHRVIFALHHGIDALRSYETIDHVNGDKYDNRIENLQGMSVLENSDKDSGRKLTDEQVREIRELLKGRETITSIAKRYNVSTTTVHSIRKGTTYKRVV